MLAFVSRIDSWRRGKDLSSTRLTRRPSDCGVRAPHALHGRAPATVGVAELCKALNRSSPQINPAIDRLGKLERENAALAFARQIIPGKRMRKHPARAASQGSRHCARMPAIAPVNTSPMPAAAMAGLPRSQIAGTGDTATPCAAARRCMPMSVPAPLSTITAPGCFASEARKRRQAVSLHRRRTAAQQPRRFARMRRQNGRRGGRTLFFRDQVRVRPRRAPGVCRRRARASEAPAPRSSVRVPGPQPRPWPPRAASRALRGRSMPCTISSGRPAAIASRLSRCGGDRHQTRANAQTRLPRQPHCAGHAGTTADDQHAPEIALVGLAPARRQGARDIGAR